MKSVGMKFALLAVLAPIVTYIMSGDSSVGTASPLEDSKLKPVDLSMHEFMEYYFQPTYRRLRETMNAPNKDRSVWKKVKSDAMILAEGGNLLLMRHPKKSEDASTWEKYSQEVRKLGGDLYRAAKKKDGNASGTAWKAMIKSCNQCHQKFANGKYQLKT